MRSGSSGTRILHGEFSGEGQPVAITLPLNFEGRVGEVAIQGPRGMPLSEEAQKQICGFLGPFLVGSISVQVRAFQWIESVYAKLKANQRDWVGIYWLESFIDPQRIDSKDLVVGPFIGPWTPHTRIGLDAGLCGLAVRENRTVNVDDVRADARFLACSTSTRSEIVIPIRNTKGQIVGELDIDSNEVGAFDKATEAKLHAAVEQFGLSLNL